MSSRLKNSGFVAAYETMMTFSNVFWISFLVISTTLVVFEIATFTSNMRASDVLSRPKIQPKSRPQIYLNTSQVPELKRILYWTPYFMAEDWQFGFVSKPFRNCPQPNCAGDNFTRNMFHHHPHCHHITKIYPPSAVTKKGDAENFDAILFHSFFSSRLIGGRIVQLKVKFHVNMAKVKDKLCL